MSCPWNVDGRKITDFFDAFRVLPDSRSPSWHLSRELLQARFLHENMLFDNQF